MEMPLSETVLIVMGLLAVAMLTAGLCRNLPIPYTVVLVLLGIVLGELCRNWPPLAHLHDFRLRPDIVFFVFLPALIFESGLSLDARQLIKDLVPILVLAVPALLISTLLIGLGLCLFLDIAPLLALLFGALISATDPVAVVALFKELGAPLRLTVLVEGESLMNDATAIVVFSILLGLAVEGQGLNWSSTGLAVVDFFRVFLGGALVGTTLGLFTSELLYRLQSGLTVIVTMSVVTAYVSFVLAEHVLQVSGVMATAAAAMAFGILGVTRLPREVTYAIEETWKVIALICNSLLFLLVGFSVHTTALVAGVGVVAVPVAVLLVLAARAATVYSLIPATTRLFSLQQVTLNERHIMWWGGLKGGLAIAIALSVPENFPGRQLLLDMALGVVLFTLLVNAPTIRPLVSKLGLDRFTDDERAELKQALRHARQRSAGVLDRFLAAGLISTACHHRVGQRTEKTLGADTPEKVGDQPAHEVYQAALRTELEELDRLYEMGVMTQYMYLDIRNTLQRDREAASGAGQRPRIGTRQRRNAFLRVEQALLRRRREHNWVAGVLFRYQKVRLSRHLQQDTVGILMSEAVLAMLRTREDLDGDQRRAIGAIYEERLARRQARIETIRQEFPAFFQCFELRLCHRVTLVSAMRSAEQAHHHGEIGAKVTTHILRRIQAALRDLPLPCAPAPALLPEELIERVPLLAELPEEAMKALARRARLMTFLPGDVLIEEGEKGDALYIIMRGEVSVQGKAEHDKDAVLEERRAGDLFGETALLGSPVRSATVTARTPTSVLRISRRDVLALAERHAGVKRRLNTAGQARKDRLR